MTDENEIMPDEVEIDMIDEQVNIETDNDDALHIAQQALDEIRSLREERDNEWKQTIETKLNEILERMQQKASDDQAETLEIETPPAPATSEKRRGRKKKRLKL